MARNFLAKIHSNYFRVMAITPVESMVATEASVEAAGIAAMVGDVGIGASIYRSFDCALCEDLTHL